MLIKDYFEMSLKCIVHSKEKIIAYQAIYDGIQKMDTNDDEFTICHMVVESEGGILVIECVSVLVNSIMQCYDIDAKKSLVRACYEELALIAYG